MLKGLTVLREKAQCLCHPHGARPTEMSLQPGEKREPEKGKGTQHIGQVASAGSDPSAQVPIHAGLRAVDNLKRILHSQRLSLCLFLISLKTKNQ